MISCRWYALKGYTFFVSFAPQNTDNMRIGPFERLFSAAELSRGRIYYQSGMVLEVEMQEDDEAGTINYFAKVKGGEGQVHEVEIELLPLGGIKSWYCDCSDDDGCKHQAAVLFKLREMAQYGQLQPASAPSKPQRPKANTPDVDQALAAYAALPLAEQRLVKIAAMLGEPVARAKLSELFNHSGFRLDGTMLSYADLDAVLPKLEAAGLLIPKAKDLECPQIILDALSSRYFSADHDFQQIAKPIRQLLPIHYSWYGSSREKHLLREMRIGRYSDNMEVFQQAFIGFAGSSYNKRSQSYWLQLTSNWLGPGFDPARLDALGPKVRPFLLAKRLMMELLDLNPLDTGFYGYGLSHIEQMDGEYRPKLADWLAQLSILKGDWEAVERLSGYVDGPLIGMYAAIRQFIAGRHEQAIDTFVKAQKERRKHLGNNREVLRGLPGIFYVLSLLKTQDAKLLQRARNHIKQVEKQVDPYEDTYSDLRATITFLENNTKAAEQMLNQPLSNHWSKFFRFFSQFWVSERLVNRPALRGYHDHLAKNGYAWMAAEVNALLGALGEPAEGFPLPESEPLYRTLPRIEEWENALKKLLELGGKAAAVAEAQDRIAWFVDFEKGSAQARHQVLGKSGWTKGRPVSFDRLRKGEVPGLTPQDVQFIKSIDYAWGSEISFYRTPELWKNLVAHPLLFLEKSPDTAVQLVETKPTLIAKQTGKGYQLKFTALDQVFGPGATIVKETPTRYLYVEVTEAIAMIARTFNGKTLDVPERGEEQLREALSGLAHIVQVQSAFEDENLPAVEADTRICVHLLSVGDGFHVELYVKPLRSAPPYVKPGEGEAYLIGILNGARTATTRKLKLEQKNLAALREKVPTLNNKRPSGGTWHLDDADACLEFLLELRPLLEAEEILLEWPKGEKFRVSSVAGFDEFRMSIRDGSGHWFEVEGELRVDDQQVLSLQELLALSQQKSAFVEVSPGKFLALTEEFRRRLRGINGMLGPQKKGGKLGLHALAAPAAEEFFQGLRHFEASQKFQDSKARLEAAYAKKFKLPKRFQAELRPYQMDGFEWLHRCAAWGVGACLADDMGLGKTVQALAFLTDRAKLGPALVAAPASVCRNWVNETARFAPALNPILFSETDDRAAAIKAAKKGDLLIVTYDLMAREELLFTSKKWATVILDEAQAIKNRATKRSETAMQLQADFRLAMTGTPIENHLGELWNLFNFLNPGLLGSIEQFAERFSGPIERDGDDNRREQLRRLVQPFVLRRRKDEVLKDLPEKTEITLTVELPPEERAFYEALRRNALEKLTATSADAQAGQQHLRILAEIMKLRRAACHPSLADSQAGFTRGAKLALFEQVVDELLDNDHKALVFSQFVDHLKILERSLKAKGIRYQYLDGSTPGKKRQQAIDAFQAGEGDIFLISLKAGGTGLNLTAADFVIHTDPWWNPAVEDQATDRAHRIGQERPVTVYRLVAEQTIEEKIIQLHAKKRDLADSLLAGADVSAKLSAEELMALLRDER
jgi:superfamily II DNA or RNA helicase